PWTQTAVLSSAGRTAPGLLETLVRDPEFTAGGAAPLQLLTRLAALVGARPGEADVARALGLLAAADRDGTAAWRVALLEGLGQGLQNSARPLNRLWEQP